VSQPFKRGATIPAPCEPDASLGEFWVDNPWDIVRAGHNLSSFERTRVFLNRRGRDFLDISSIAGADTDGDGRSVVAGDFRNNGQLEVVLRQAGGGPLLLYENHFPQRHYLNVSLRGRRPSNRQGIGARLTAVTGELRQVREMYPLNSFQSQTPNIVHFGLGKAERVDRLVIRWPSGTEQVLRDLPADRHILVEEGSATVATVVPGKPLRP
jgi:hypothetical protein